MTARVRTDSQRGFTIIEVMIAALVILVALGVVVTAAVGMRHLSSTEETKSEATKIAQRELEKLRSLGWGQLEMDGTPTASGGSSAKDPLSSVYLSGTNYRPSTDAAWQPLDIGTAPDPGVIDTRGVQSAVGTWTADKYSGKIYRFVTYGTDTALGSNASPSYDYKRITVAVTVDASATTIAGDQTTVSAAKSVGIESPIIVSTVIANPTDTKVTTQTGSGTPPAVKNYLTYYMYDNFASLGTDVGPSANHTKVDTHAKPLLMDVDPPPDPNPDPSNPTIVVPTYDYSSDIPSPGTTFGRTIQKDPNCDKYDTGHVLYWVSPILTADTKITGNATADLYTQTPDGLSHPGRVCISVWDVPGTLKADGSINGTETQIGSTATAQLNPWYTSYDELEVNFCFISACSSYYTVLTGRRIGVKLTVADHLSDGTTAANDLNFMYDHPDYPSSLGFETQ
jgi:prepilin-type N-terminal cleavage/methylation domain-containing protein